MNTIGTFFYYEIPEETKTAMDQLWKPFFRWQFYVPTSKSTDWPFPLLFFVFPEEDLTGPLTDVEAFISSTTN